MWLSEDEQLVLRYLQIMGEVGASAREICRKAATKNAWKENEHWAFPFLSSLKDKKLIETTPTGNYRIPPPKDQTSQDGMKK